MFRPVSTLHAKLAEILVEHLSVERDECTLDSKLVEDLGADSLDLVEVAMYCEDVFHLPDHALDEDMAVIWERRGTVGQLLTLIERALERQHKQEKE
jgi:acyl carrier protein